MKATAGQQNLVVIGNGMAGMRTVEELLKLAPDRYRITVFGAEPYGNYNRIMLSPVLAGEMSVSDIMIHDHDWYKANNIRLYSGPAKQVVRVDRRNRTVHTADGTVAVYDRLLLATGSDPFMLPVPGNDLQGVIAFRTINDVDTMLSAAGPGRRAVVVGGGLLGLEAANGLNSQGMDVTVVHNVDVLLNRQLDRTAASYLQQELESRGIRFRLAARTTGFETNDQKHVSGVTLNDGTSLAADLVVVAAGIRPRTDLASAMGLHCERGIVVSDSMQTFDPRIYAVGECVQHRGALFGLVAPIWDQARVCAHHLAGTGLGIYVKKEISTKLKVTGIDLYSAGEFNADNENPEDRSTTTQVFQDPVPGVYKKLVFRGNLLVGAVLFGDTRDGAWYFSLMQERRDISTCRDLLVFGKHFAERLLHNEPEASPLQRVKPVGSRRISSETASAELAD